MTYVDFYFNVTDKQTLLFDLLEDALAKRRKVTVHVQNEDFAQKLNGFLWQKNQLSFLPSVLETSELAEQTAIVIDWQGKHLVQDDMLVNMQSEEPLFFSRFKQLVELVGQDENDKQRARQRYKFYRDRGYEIRNIDQAKKE